MLPELPDCIRGAWTTVASKRRRSLSAPERSPTQARAAKRLCTSPKPVQMPPSFSDKAKSPPRANGSNPKPAPKPKVLRFPNLKGKGLNSVWEIPRVAKDILVLGDSNLSRVTWIGRSDAQVVSYPGLKLMSLFALLKGFKFGSGSPNPGRKPGKVVLSAGINDKASSPGTNKISLQKVVNMAMKIFPGSQICLAQIAYSATLDITQRCTIKALNAEMEFIASKKPCVSCIPLIPKPKFKVIRDNIHWTEDCANATINHFFDHLN